MLMKRAREITNYYSGMIHLEQQIVAMEKALGESHYALVIDLAKAMVETACKTILKKLEISLEHDCKFQTLLKETLKALDIVHNTRTDAPEEQFSEGVRKMVSGFGVIAQGIAEVRNLEGVASHGKDAFHVGNIEKHHAEMFYEFSDSVISFLFNAFRQIYFQEEEKSELRYEDNQELNEYIDQENENVRIFDQDYSPSEVLFNIDPISYKELKVGFVEDNEGEDELQNDE